MYESILILVCRLAFIFLVIFLFFAFYKINNVKFELSHFFRSFLGLFTLGFAFVHGIVPILQDLNPSYYRLSSGYSFENKVLATSFVSVFYAFFMFFYSSFILISRRTPVQRKIYYLSTEDFGKKIKILNFAFLFVPAFLSVFFIFNLVFRANLSELLLDRISVFRGLGGVLLLSNILSFLGVFYFCSFYKRRKIFDFVIYGWFFALMLVTFTLVGSRNSFFIFLLLNLVVFFRVGGRISNLRLITISCLALVFFTLAGYFRLRTEQFGASELFSLLADNLFGSIISVFGTDEVLLYLMSKDFNDYQLGKTFYSALTNFIPRSIWPEKPLGAGPLLTNFIHPGSYGLELSNVSSYTTGIISESFINFGWAGTFIVPLIFALLARGLDSIKSLQFYSLLLSSYFLIMFGFAIFYSEFLGLVSRGLYVAFPLFLCITVLKASKFKRV